MMSEVKNMPGAKPQIDPSVFVADGARIVNDVEIGAESGVWYNAVIRGDEGRIKIGERTNVQDNATLHSGDGHVCTVGNGVTIGHNAIVHGCTVGDNVIIGMGAIILNGATVEDDCIIGAGSLVTQGKVIPKGHMAFGNPAKVIRPLTDEETAFIRKNAQIYVDLAASHKQNRE